LPNISLEKDAQNSRIAIVQTRDGWYLRVIYVPDPEPDRVFVITAYELVGEPLKYEKRTQET